ncbi:hypothetical protein XA68_15907 [Ophiocordyceps unilateralis]|uniref:Uncharacterized protein n=1 Tax=Ophiocordyceps unilateralis TaxID=268505 RepID=A0A2A9PLH3_OPHUN|nr:hypothetical protein XA68_15907 [Ophiocordyceps unilateralis]
MSAIPSLPTPSDSTALYYDALVGAADDALIPTPSAIRQMFNDGMATWQEFLDEAKKMKAGLWPAGSLDPYITLVDTPALPASFRPARFLYGRPLWKVDDGFDSENTTKTGKADDEKWDPSLRYGRRVGIKLSGHAPLRGQFSPYAKTALLKASPKTMGSIAILTLCWSYILSARFLEMQKGEMVYSENRERPNQPRDGYKVPLCMDGASPALVRWICAVATSPYMGWLVVKGKLPPWAACLWKSGVQIIIETEDPTTDTCSAPSSAEALDLLVEFCRLFGLGKEESHDDKYESMSPYREAFFAALLLPYYNAKGHQPQFPDPNLTRADGSKFTDADEKLIRGYGQDMRYFMTISVNPSSVASILWSVFWQPDVNCNLVSPWLASIMDVLSSTLGAQDLETLIKVFILRRPRVAPWWLAVFLLGDLFILDSIEHYLDPRKPDVSDLTKHDSDPMLSAWTGSKQSFVECPADADRPGSTLGGNPDLVSRADLLRYRSFYKLQDNYLLPLAWRPFGYIKKQDIEPELWPYLHLKPALQYQHFTWYIGKQASPPSLGFRRDTGRDVKNVGDDLTRRSAANNPPIVRSEVIRVPPSQESTLRMVSFLADDSMNVQCWGNVAMPVEVAYHPWLFNWNLRSVKDLWQYDAEMRARRIFLQANPRREFTYQLLMKWLTEEHQEGDEDTV